MRNSRPGFKIENLIAILTILTCSATSLYAAEYTTCEAFHKTGGLGFWGWTLIVGSAVALGVTEFFTFGGTAVAAPAWMGAVGTWIGGSVGLSGAAAANWGLAVLGGGAVAAGGLGIAGGVAVLTAASTFGTGVLVDYSVDKAMSHWSYRQFVAESKDMLSLPIPQNTDGGRAYERTVEFIHKKFDKKQPLSAPEKQKVLRETLGKLQGMMPDEDDLGYRLKDATLLALLYFQLGDYGNAEKSARDVFRIAGPVKKYRMAMPHLLLALSSLYGNDLTGEKIWKTAQSFRAALIAEPESEIMPIALAACLDRVMNLYHYGKCGIAVFEELSKEFSKNVHADIAPKAFAVMATR